MNANICLGADEVTPMHTRIAFAKLEVVGQSLVDEHADVGSVSDSASSRDQEIGNLKALFSRHDGTAGGPTL